MKIGAEGLIILASIVIVSYFAYTTYMNDNLIKIKSTVDNNEYFVQDKDDAAEAANLIAQIRKNLILLVEHLIKSHPPDDIRIILLKENFNPDALREVEDGSSYTSYSINKGEKIVLCLRNKDGLVNINTMMFVCLHELAHVCNETIGHDAAFWDTFRWILEESINIGIYKKQKFAEHPEPYCGMIINSSPLP